VPLPADPGPLVAAAANGDRRALARLISIVEDGRDGAADALRAAHPLGGGGYRIGVTGAPGAGKSTLTDRLVGEIRADGDTVAVLAVDPTSPFSGGAVLGDRVRMQDRVSDPGVYIRSMASRGHLGGLSAAAPRALAMLDAAGFPYLLIETVGVGQDEVEITRAADTTIVVVTPGWGDGIQAAKAGILEIGDVFVVNKADRAGVDDTVADLRTMLTMGPDRAWTPPIVPTVAERGDGIAELWSAVVEHRGHLARSGLLDEGRRRRRRSELEVALVAAFSRQAAELAAGGPGADLVARVEAGDLDPWTAAELLLAAAADPA
jgi:LAO/AO transport system kinase